MLQVKANPPRISRQVCRFLKASRRVGRPDAGPTTLPNGEACTADADCTSGYCDDANADAKVCANAPPPKALGEACTENSECATGSCRENSDGEVVCSPAPVANGQPCENSDDCVSSHCDYQNGGVCADAPLEDGTACTAHAQCRSKFCKSDVCTAQVSPGAACDFGDVCIDGAACNASDASTPGTCECDANHYPAYGGCAVKRDTGTPCDQNEQCKSGSCFGTCQ